jgi:uncharacterized protein
MMTKIKYLLWALCLFNAIRVEALQYDAVMDDVQMLGPAATAEIRSIGDRLNKEGKVQFAVKVVADCKDTLLDGRAFFNNTGIGDKIKNNGLLLYINAANFKAGRPNKVRLLTGYGMEGMFNDAKCGRILDDGLAKKSIDDKVLTMVRLIDKEFKALGDAQPPAKDTSVVTVENIKCVIFWIIVIIVVVVVIAGVLDGEGGGGYSNGGYHSGGSSGGGGFSCGGGGFGGGSCGGGGAGR